MTGSSGELGGMMSGLVGLLGFLAATFGDVGGCTLFELESDTVCVRLIERVSGDGVRGRAAGLGGLLGFLLTSPVAGLDPGVSSPLRCRVGSSRRDLISTGGLADGVNGRSWTALFAGLALAGDPDLSASFFPDAGLAPFPPSNMDISDPVGAIDPESTTSPTLLPTLIAPTLTLLLGERAFGLGLTLRLAASVAAIKLGLFESTLPGEGDDEGEDSVGGWRNCWCWWFWCGFCCCCCPRCCSRAATMLRDAAASISGRPVALPPVLCVLSVAAARAPLPTAREERLGLGGAEGFLLWKAREAPLRAAAAAESVFAPPVAWAPG